MKNKLLITLICFLTFHFANAQTFTQAEQQKVLEGVENIMSEYITQAGFAGDVATYDFNTREQSFGKAFKEIFNSPADQTICYNDLDPTGQTGLFHSPNEYLEHILLWYKKGVSLRFLNEKHQISAPKSFENGYYVTVSNKKEISGIYVLDSKFYKKQYDLAFVISFQKQNHVISNFKIAAIKLQGETPMPTVKDRDKDGIPDDEDKCPDQFGAKTNGGCPEQKKVKHYTETINTISFDMVSVKGGTFFMENDKANAITIAPFELGETEVTQELWESIMESSPSYFLNCVECPVEQISFEDVEEFLNRLNNLTNQNYRLPTEAEWEYAHQKGKSSQQIQNKSIGQEIRKGISRVSQDEETKSVKSSTPNALGLYGLDDNVSEWCVSDNESDEPEQSSGGLGAAVSSDKIEKVKKSTPIHKGKGVIADGNVLIGFRLVK